MGKTKQDDPFLTLREQFKEMEKENKQLKEKNKECEKKNKVLEKQLKALQDKKTAESKDINDELSDYAQLAIRVSRGPLKPHELEKFLINDVFGKSTKHILTVIRKYSSNIDEMKEQLLWLHNNVEMIHRAEQKKLDVRLIKTLKKLQETIEKDQENPIYAGQNSLKRSSDDNDYGRYKRERTSSFDD